MHKNAIFNALCQKNTSVFFNTPCHTLTVSHYNFWVNFCSLLFAIFMGLDNLKNDLNILYLQKAQFFHMACSDVQNPFWWKLQTFIARQLFDVWTTFCGSTIEAKKIFRKSEHTFFRGDQDSRSILVVSLNIFCDPSKWV